MSERKITAPGPGWRMPGKAKSTNIRDAMPNLLNAMGDSIERSNKMDFGTPGIHTQNGFHQPHEAGGPGLSWVILVDAIPAGSYSEPAISRAKMLISDNTLSEGALREGTEEVLIYNYAAGFSASAGDWVLVAPFNGVLIALSSGGGGGGAEIVRFEILSACPGLTGDNSADACNCVFSIVTRNNCESSTQVGDLITVWDVDNCWLNVPLELLVGRSGTAILMQNNVDDGSAPNCTGFGELRPGDCYWNVESLCCSEEVYAT